MKTPNEIYKILTDTAKKHYGKERNAFVGINKIRYLMPEDATFEDGFDEADVTIEIEGDFGSSPKGFTFDPALYETHDFDLSINGLANDDFIGLLFDAVMTKVEKYCSEDCPF